MSKILSIMNAFSVSSALIFACFCFNACSSCEQESPAALPTEVVQEKVSMIEMANKATVAVTALYDLRWRSQEGDIYFTVDGDTTSYRSTIIPHTLRGTGVVIQHEGSYRVLTAKHLAFADPGNIIEKNPYMFRTVLSILGQLGIRVDLLGEEDLVELATNWANNNLELVPLSSPGHIIKSGTSAVAYQDQFSQNPRITPKVANQYQRSEFGLMADYAIVNPENQNMFDTLEAFRLEDLATDEELERYSESKDRQVFNAGFQNVTGTISFNLTPSEGKITEYMTDFLAVTLDNTSNGSSGGVVVNESKILGIVSGNLENKVIIVPAPLIRHKLKRAFNR